MNETLLRQAMARGYCTPENEKKELDAVLINAMVKEILSIPIEPPVMPKIADAWEDIKPNYPCEFVAKKTEHNYTIYRTYSMSLEDDRLLLHDNQLNDYIEIDELNADKYLVLEKR